MILLAVCQGSDPDVVGGILILLVAVVVYVLPLAFAFVRAQPRIKKELAALWVLGVGLSVVFGYVIPGGSSSDADYLALFLFGILLGAGIGLVTGIRRGPKIWRYLLVGALGGATFLAAGALNLILWLTVTGSCLD